MKKSLGLFFIILIFASIYAQSMKPTPELPDFKQQPFYLYGESSKQSSVFHPELGSLSGKLYLDVKEDANGNADLNGKTSANAVMIYYDSNGEICYAEQSILERVFDKDKMPVGDRAILRGFTYDKTQKKFVFEKECLLP